MFFFFCISCYVFLEARLFPLFAKVWNSPSFSLVLRTKTAEQRIVLIPYRASGLPWPFLLAVACSQTLYFLFKVRRARVIKYKPRVNRGRFIDLQRKGVGGRGGGRRKWTLFFFLALCARSRALASSPMFLKRTKRKIKQRLFTGSVLAVTLQLSEVTFLADFKFVNIYLISIPTCFMYETRGNWN